MEKNGCFQNSLTNTCKNEAGKPVFTRVSRGYCRNEVSPFRALTLIWGQVVLNNNLVEMKLARLGH